MVTLHLKPALRWGDVRPGDVVHEVAGQIVGIDRGDEHYRLALLWGTSDVAAVRELIDRYGWDARGLSAAGAYVRAHPPPPAWRDPVTIAARLPDRPGQFDGLRGGRQVTLTTSYHYDVVSAYPALALSGVPDPAGWREYREPPEEQAGYVLFDGDHDAGMHGVVRGWITIDEWHFLRSHGLVIPWRRIYATPRTRWSWLERAAAELLELKAAGGPLAGPAKAALNGLIGRFASRSSYRRYHVGGGGSGATTYIRTGDGTYISARVVDCSRHDARYWSLTHDVIARQRLRLAGVVERYQAVWWYVDAVTVPSPLPEHLTGSGLGQWRPVAVGPSRILDWRGGLVAGRVKMASVPRAVAAGVVAVAAAAG